MRARRWYRWLSALLLPLAITTSPALAGDPFAGLSAVADQELDTMRGGYALADGLEVSFGIERAVFVDGVLQVVQTLTAALMTDMLHQQAATRNIGLSAVNGTPILEGDFAVPRVGLAAADTVLAALIQNSDDHRIIDSITTINATITSLGLFRQLNAMTALQQQLVIGP
ncbi:MAG: hypothetical protein AB1568_08550 [Thermodesulfobacteriota bacterium]